MFVANQKKMPWGNQHGIHLTYKQLWISTPANPAGLIWVQKYIKG